MAWTEEELEAIRKADEEIDAEFQGVSPMEARLANKLDRESQLNQGAEKTTAEKRREYQKAYYRKNRERKRAYHKAYYQAHKEKIDAQRKLYYQTHKEDLKQRKHIWYVNNKEAIKKQQAEYKRRKRIEKQAEKPAYEIISCHPWEKDQAGNEKAFGGGTNYVK